MKASQFASILRKLIHEEVRSAVKEELKPIKALLSEGRKPIKTTPTQKINAPKRTTPLVTFEGPISQILNETAQNMNTTQEEWPEMNGNMLTSEHAQNFGATSLMSMMDSDNDELPSTGRYADPTTSFVKDYSAVLKAADAIANGKI
jgi:hypothetical protein